jgi:hypothetical protein
LPLTRSEMRDGLTPRISEAFAWARFLAAIN